jgi:hypothetical protein
MKSRSFRVFAVFLGLMACGYFAFTTRYRIEATIWHLRHGYSTRMGNFDVPVPKHWLIYSEDSLAFTLVNTAPTWHRDGNFHTVAAITLFPFSNRPISAEGTARWLLFKRQQAEREGVTLVEEKRFTFDDDTLVCVGGSEMRDVILRGVARAPKTDIISLECKSENGLTILFQGEPTDVDAFYSWVSQIRRQK